MRFNNSNLIAKIIKVAAQTVGLHSIKHAVGGADAVFPADPNADKFLKWNNTSNQIEWADAGGSFSGTLDDIGAGTTNKHLTTTLKSNYDAAYDYSQEEHAPSNAEENVNADWNATEGDAQILNRPTYGVFAIGEYVDNDIVPGFAETSWLIIAVKGDWVNSDETTAEITLTLTYNTNPSDFVIIRKRNEIDPNDKTPFYLHKAFDGGGLEETTFSVVADSGTVENLRWIVTAYK